jgi:hypothetical protein
MKRKGYLFESLYSFENLFLAWKKASTGCRKNLESSWFYFFLEPELLKLQKEIKTFTYKPGAFRYFTVSEPKRRTIAVAPFRDRVVHHAVINLLEPVYEQVFIFDSYATRKNKGTHKAIQRARQMLKTNRWFYKMDVQKYFDSINHDILKTLLRRKIKDVWFLNLIFKIIDNGGKEGKGLPIGNLTSQFLANVYLNSFDHFIKENLQVKFYIRYMDDFVFFHNDKEQLKQWKKETERFLYENLALTLKDSASYLNRSCHGLSYLGARIFPNMLRIHPDTLRRSKKGFSKRRHEYEHGLIDEATYLLSLNSLHAHIRFFTNTSFRRDVYTQVSV